MEGINVNETNDRGDTALSMAYYSDAIRALLLTHGATENVEEREGESEVENVNVSESESEVVEVESANESENENENASASG